MIVNFSHFVTIGGGETYTVERRDCVHNSGITRDVDDTGRAIYARPRALLQEVQECRSYKEWRKGVDLED